MKINPKLNKRQAFAYFIALIQDKSPLKMVLLHKESRKLYIGLKLFSTTKQAVLGELDKHNVTAKLMTCSFRSLRLDFKVLHSKGMYIQTNIFEGWDQDQKAWFDQDGHYYFINKNYWHVFRDHPSLHNRRCRSTVIKNKY